MSKPAATTVEWDSQRDESSKSTSKVRKSKASAEFEEIIIPKCEKRKKTYAKILTDGIKHRVMFLYAWQGKILSKPELCYGKLQTLNSFGIVNLACVVVNSTMVKFGRVRAGLAPYDREEKKKRETVEGVTIHVSQLTRAKRQKFTNSIGGNRWSFIPELELGNTDLWYCTPIPYLGPIAPVFPVFLVSYEIDGIYLSFLLSCRLLITNRDRPASMTAKMKPGYAKFGGSILVCASWMWWWVLKLAATAAESCFLGRVLPGTQNFKALSSMDEVSTAKW